VPGSPLAVPAGVTTACWPMATWLTWLSLIVPVTWNDPGVRMMKFVLVELAALDAAADALDEAVVTGLPTVTLIAATVPPDGASRLLSLTDVVSLVTVCCAWATLAVSWAAAAYRVAALLELLLLVRALFNAV